MGIDRYTKVGLRRTRWRRRTRHAVPIVFPVLSKLRRLDPRIPLTSAVIAAICANFWLGSRYPSLQGKASADPNQALSTPLGFEAHFPEPPPSDFLAHALWTALEWAITNRQGMTFGLLLAAGMLTLLPLLPRPRGGRFAGAMQGAIVGAPLGVCVNCAAPIAQGMLVSGSRLEVALATLFSSPSFNVIVVSMLFTLFPWHLVALKLGASALVVLLAVPLLAKLGERPGWRRPPRREPRLPGMGLFRWLDALIARAGEGPQATDKAFGGGFLQALGWVAMTYPRNLLRIVVLALPLMLLAGLLGAILVELLPWDRLTALAHLDAWWQMLGVVVLASAFGTLLPVPIAFDIVICSVLWSAGVPAWVLAPLLVTLGIYSVYPWAILGTTLSWKLASVAGLCVILAGLISGAGAALLQRWHEIDQAHAAQAILNQYAAVPEPTRALPEGHPAGDLQGLAPPLQAPELLRQGPDWQLQHQAFQAPATPVASARFERIDGPQLGLTRLPLPRPYQGMEPTVMHLGALAGGDVDQDGWPDLAVGSYFGVFLYRNLGGRFEQQQIDFPAMRDWIIGDVALVDLDGDGALDLFFGTWMHGSHILFNREGRFSESAHVALERDSETVVTAVAFADFDRDGDLDIVTGGSTFAAWFYYPELARNFVWRNQGAGQFRREALPGPEGDTLSLLFHDLDGDGWEDLLVGNDFDEPDRVFLNREGNLHAATVADSPLPWSTTTTMSFDAGDLNNDGAMELYISQIAMGRMNELPGKLADPWRSCGIYEDVADRARCDKIVGFQTAVVRARNVERVQLCRELDDPQQVRDCAVTAYHWNRIIVRQPSLGASHAEIMRDCARIPADFETMQDLCAALAASELDYNQAARNFPQELPQVARTNLLFSPQQGQYRDVTAQWRSGFGGWSWNAQFGDLDNDGWLDLYIAQGSRLRASSPYSPVYHNQSGRGFADVTRAWGLEDHRPTGAYLYMDFDRDGDLDLLSYPFLLSPVLWRNHGGGKGLSIRLEDRTAANAEAIGARITLHREAGPPQTRVLKASGGYQSHRSVEAHFGLGEASAAKALEVHWPDGQHLRIDGPLPPGLYRLQRHAP